MQSELRKLDSVCMEFEDSWQPKQGIGSIQKILGQQQVIDEQLPASRLFVELSLIDIERTWQDWGLQDFANIEIDELRKRLVELRSRTKYVPVANALDIDLSEDQKREIEAKEVVSRVKYGDVPRELEVLDSELLKTLQIHQPVISIAVPGKQHFKQSFVGKILVGRQSEGEPEPFSWFEHNGQTKLICALGRYPQISRTQLAIEVINRSYALVDNLSSNRHFCIGSDAILAPQNCTLAKLPLTIDLSILKVHVSRQT